MAVSFKAFKYSGPSAFDVRLYLLIVRRLNTVSFIIHNIMNFNVCNIFRSRKFVKCIRQGAWNDTVALEKKKKKKKKE